MSQMPHGTAQRAAWHATPPAQRACPPRPGAPAQAPCKQVACHPAGECIVLLLLLRLVVHAGALVYLLIGCSDAWRFSAEALTSAGTKPNSGIARVVVTQSYNN